MLDNVNDILKDVPRGVATRYLKEQTAPMARWQLPENIAASQTLSYNPYDPGKKILMGALRDKLIGFEDNRHIITIAGTRAGKSVTVIANLLLYQGSVLAIDPKGELANKTAKARAKMGQKVYVLDPFNNCSAGVNTFKSGYNPMSALKTNSPTIIEDAAIIAEAIVVSSSSKNKDPHWDDCARNFIEGIILHVATNPAFQSKVNLVTVWELINDALMPAPENTSNKPMFMLEQDMQENAALLSQIPFLEDAGSAIASATRSFYEKSEKERDSVLSSVRRHMDFLRFPAMKRILSQDGFNLSELKTSAKGMTIYLCFPATRIDMSTRWLRLFINQLLDAMERERTAPPAPVLVCLDEFPVLGYMKQLENAIGQIASFDVKLWVILQDWGQGKALYGARWESFAGNAGIIQFFGNNDVTTTEYISKRLGKTRIEVTRTSEVGQKEKEFGLSGLSTSQELHDLMTPDEIMRTFARSDKLKRQVIFWAGYRPLILQRVEYYDRDSTFFPLFNPA